MGHTVGATCQQGILTPPRHLIPPPVFPGVYVSPFAYLTCNSSLNLETDFSLLLATLDGIANRINVLRKEVSN
jgi:hypothetical protein